MNLFSNKLNWSERRMILQNENIFDLCEKFNVNFNPIFYKVLNQDKEYDRLTNEGDFQFVISGFPNTYKSSFCSKLTDKQKKWFEKYKDIFKSCPYDICLNTFKTSQLWVRTRNKDEKFLNWIKDLEEKVLQDDIQLSIVGEIIDY